MGTGDKVAQLVIGVGLVISRSLVVCTCMPGEEGRVSTSVDTRL